MAAHPSERLIGVVLAGGQSKRFGRDKVLLALGSGADRSPLLERAFATVADAVGGRVVVADRGRNLHPGAQSIEDGPGRGPAAAILGAAAIDPQAAVVVLACDMPFVTSEVLRALLEIPGDLVMPRWQLPAEDESDDSARRHATSSLRSPTFQHEPLCAVFRSRAIDTLRAQVATGTYALHSLLDTRLGVSFLEGSQLDALGPPNELFLNVNRVSDLERASALRAVRRLAPTTGSG